MVKQGDLFKGYVPTRTGYRPVYFRIIAIRGRDYVIRIRDLDSSEGPTAHVSRDSFEESIRQGLVDPFESTDCPHCDQKLVAVDTSIRCTNGHTYEV